MKYLLSLNSCHALQWSSKTSIYQLCRRSVILIQCSTNWQIPYAFIMCNSIEFFVLFWFGLFFFSTTLLCFLSQCTQGCQCALPGAGEFTRWEHHHTLEVSISFAQQTLRDLNRLHFCFLRTIKVMPCWLILCFLQRLQSPAYVLEMNCTSNRRSQAMNDAYIEKYETNEKGDDFH